MKFCSIASGSSGNCIFAGSEHSSVLVDAGLSRIRIERGLSSIDRSARDIDAVLITHEHSDHIKGVGVLARKYGLPIFTTEGTARELAKNSSVGTIPDGLLRIIHADEPFAIGDLYIKPFAISHDAAEPVGFRIECAGKSAAVVTDMGCYTDYIVQNLKDLDVLLLEANHDVRMLEAGPYPYYLKRRILSDHGHLSNEASGKLLGRLLNDGIRHVFLGHLSKENNYEELAYETVCTEVTFGDNPYKARDFEITIARRDEPSMAVNW